MEIIQREKQLLNEREEESFQRFLERCQAAYEECSIWSYVNQKLNYEGSIWQDQESERQSCQEKLAELSLPSGIQEQSRPEHSTPPEESEDQPDNLIDKREGNDE